MRLVALDQINGKEVLGKPIFDVDGRKLLNSGVSLRPAIIQKLYEKGISSIYIDDDISEGIEIDSILCEETKTHAKIIVREEMQRLSQKKTMDYSKLSGVVDKILDEILSRKIEMVNVKDIRMQDEQTFAHSVNVCVMAIALASKLSLTIPKIKVLLWVLCCMISEKHCSLHHFFIKLMPLQTRKRLKCKNTPLSVITLLKTTLIPLLLQKYRF